MKFKVGDRVRWSDRGMRPSSLGELGTVYKTRDAEKWVGVKWDRSGHNNEDWWNQCHFYLVHTPQSPFEKLVFDYITSELPQ